jgi:hypothetical protein
LQHGFATRLLEGGVDLFTTPSRNCWATATSAPPVAISNERIRSINKGEVAFTVGANDRGGKRLHRMDGIKFVRRFMLHVLPTVIKRIGHYGVLAARAKSSTRRGWRC